MEEGATPIAAAVLDVVALLTDAPAEGLQRGQVGTIVEPLNEATVLVEFSDPEQTGTKQ